LIGVDDAVSGRDRLRRIAEQGIVDAERLCELPVDVRRIDADGEVRYVVRSNLIATLTE